MSRSLYVALVLMLGCRADSRPRAVADAGPATQPGPAAEGRFFSRGPNLDEYPLIARQFSVRVTPGPGSVRSHLVLEVGSAQEAQTEAIVRLAMPRGAAVTSATLWVNGQPMKGAMVDRQHGTAIYRSIVDRRRDPALVVWDGTGWLAISIFPLSRQDPRRFELEWVEPAAVVGGQVRYRVPAIAEGGRRLAISAVEVDGRAVSAAPEISLGPAKDLEMVRARAPGDPFDTVLARGRDAAGAPHLVLVVETSAATAKDRIGQRAAIASVLQALPPGSKATIMSADWEAPVFLEAAPSSGWEEALRRLDARVSAGALHLERALLAAATRARTTSATGVVYIGPGRDRFPGDALRAPLTALREANLRLSVIGPPSSPLVQAAELTGGEAVAPDAVERALPALMTAVRPRGAPPANVRGASHWHPLATFTGQTVWLARALAEPSPGEDRGLAPRFADLMALWDLARLPWAGREGRAAPPALALTPARALLVLESAADYQTFGLAAPESGATTTGSPIDVLGGLVGGASGGAGARPATRVVPLSGSPANQGGLALSGTASSGGANLALGGASYGILGTRGGDDWRTDDGSGPPAQPSVTLDKPVVRGALDPELVRRFIRRHMAEIRFCYEKELVFGQRFGGRVVVRFTVAQSGQVESSVTHYSTVRRALVEMCMVEATQRWEFPRPANGHLAIVHATFVLKPDGPVRSAPAPGVKEDREANAALALLAGGGTLEERTTRIAARLALPRITDPEALAWTIDRSLPGARRTVLVARLLAQAGRPRDAVRILSERAGVAPEAMAAELERLGARADAAEVRALARRGR